MRSPRRWSGRSRRRYRSCPRVQTHLEPLARAGCGPRVPGVRRRRLLVSCARRPAPSRAPRGSSHRRGPRRVPDAGARPGHAARRGARRRGRGRSPPALRASRHRGRHRPHGAVELLTERRSRLLCVGALDPFGFNERSVRLCMFHPNGVPLERGWVGRVDGDGSCTSPPRRCSIFLSGGARAREHAEYALPR